MRRTPVTLLIAALLSSSLVVPVAASDQPPSTTDLLPGVDLVTEEVEPGVYRVLSDGVRELELGFPGWEIAPGLDGSVLLSSGDPARFFRLGGPVTHFDPDPRIIEDMGETFTSPFRPMGAGPTGTVWGQNRPGDAQDDLASWDGQRWVAIEEPGYMNLPPDGWGDEPYPGDSLQVVLDADGSVWVAAESWLEGSLDQLFRVSEAGFEPAGVVDWIAGDATGELILVGDHDGIKRATAAGLELYSEATGLDDSEPVGAASDGTLWWTTTVDACPVSLARLDTEGWSTFDIPDGVVTDRFGGCGVTVAPDGSVWVGHGGFDVPGAGIHRFDGSTWTQHLASLTVFDLAIAPDGSVWLEAQPVLAEQGSESPSVRGGLYVITPEAVAAAE